MLRSLSEWRMFIAAVTAHGGHTSVEKQEGAILGLEQRNYVDARHVSGGVHGAGYVQGRRHAGQERGRTDDT